MVSSTARIAGASSPTGRLREFLLDLFEPAAAHAGTSRAEWLVGLASMGLGAAILLARQSGILAYRTVWAEDGMFLTQALHDGLASLLIPYNGYLNTGARAIALAATMPPLADAAVVLAAGSALIAAMLAVFVYHASGSLIEGRSLRVALAALGLLLPPLQHEAMNNAANVHFLLLYAAWWALLWRPARRAGAVASVVVVGLAGLSDPFVLLFAPIVGARLLAHRRPTDLGVGVVWGVAALIQLATAYLAGPSGASVGEAHAIPYLYALRVVTQGALGIGGADAVWAIAGPATAFVALAGLLAFVWYVASNPRGRSTLVILGAVGYSVLFFAVAGVVRWAQFAPPQPDAIGETGSRLTVVPILLLASAAAIAVDRGRPRLSQPARVAATVLLAAWFVFLCTVDFSSANAGRALGPEWAPAVTEAAQACVGDRASVAVPITPQGWYADVPCTDVSP